MAIWNKIAIEITDKRNIIKKLDILIEKYQMQVKKNTNHEAFAEEWRKQLFFIGTCKCPNLKENECACGLIPVRLREFILDQHNNRT